MAEREGLDHFEDWIGVYLDGAIDVELERDGCFVGDVRPQDYVNRSLPWTYAVYFDGQKTTIRIKGQRSQ